MKDHVYPASYSVVPGERKRSPRHASSDFACPATIYRAGQQREFHMLFIWLVAMHNPDEIASNQNCLNISQECRDDFFISLGMALYYAQVLERIVADHLVLTSVILRKAVTPEDVTSLYTGSFEKTLGRLQNDLGKLISVPPNISSGLKNSLEKRNYLCHRYVRENWRCFAHEDGYREMTKELTLMWQQFKRLYDTLMEIMLIMFENFGMARKEYEQLRMKLIQATVRNCEGQTDTAP